MPGMSFGWRKEDGFCVGWKRRRSGSIGDKLGCPTFLKQSAFSAQAVRPVSLGGGDWISRRDTSTNGFENGHTVRNESLLV